MDVVYCKSLTFNLEMLGVDYARLHFGVVMNVHTHLPPRTLPEFFDSIIMPSLTSLCEPAHDEHPQICARKCMARSLVGRILCLS